MLTPLSRSGSSEEGRHPVFETGWRVVLDEVVHPDALHDHGHAAGEKGVLRGGEGSETRLKAEETVGAEALGVAGDPAGGSEILRRIHRDRVTVPETAAEPVTEVAPPPTGFGREMAENGNTAIFPVAGDGFIERLQFGDGSGRPVGFESGLPEHLLVPVQRGDGRGDGEAPEVPPVGADLPEDVDVLIGSDARRGRHPVKGNEGVVFDVDRDGGIGQGGQIGGIASGRGEEKLALELAYVEATDPDFRLRVIEVVDDAVEGFFLEPGPTGPEGDLDRLV
ncbi:MAG: hypothetical protein R3F07_14275 [Opitutaceae bacterium]